MSYTTSTSVPVMHERRHDDPKWTARVHLAAANRLAVFHELEEGIDNHFTMAVPGVEHRSSSQRRTPTYWASSSPLYEWI